MRINQYWLAGCCGALLAQNLYAGELGSGETVAGAITTPQEQCRYTLAARGGERVKIRLSQVDPTLQPCLKLTDPAGKFFASADSKGGKDRAAHMNVVLPRAGAYELICRDRQAGTGRFAVAVLFLDGRPLSARDAEIGGMKMNERQTGVIDHPGDMDAVFFEGRQGDQLHVRMAELDAALNPSIQLYDAGGACLASSDSPPPYQQAEIQLVLPADGRYTLLCQDRYINTGRYTVAVRRAGKRDAAPAANPPLQMRFTFPGTPMEE